jgi:hypothetical protein
VNSPTRTVDIAKNCPLRAPANVEAGSKGIPYRAEDLRQELVRQTGRADWSNGNVGKGSGDLYFIKTTSRTADAAATVGQIHMECASTG